MFNPHRKYRAALFVILALLGGVSLIALEDLRVFVQISLNASCSNTEIEKHIKQLENKELEAEAYDAIVKCNFKSVSALIKALKNKDEKVHIVAIDALGEIGLNAEPAVPSLINALKDKDFMVRSSATDALGKIGKKSKSTTIELINALQHENENVRIGTANALGKIGYRAKDALPTLKKVSSQDINFHVIVSANIAISKIDSHKIPRPSKLYEAHSPTPQIRQAFTDYNEKPLVICKIPVIKNILWKCPKNSINKKPNS